MRGARAVCLFLFTIRPIKFSTCEVVIPVAVVDAKTLYCVSSLYTGASTSSIESKSFKVISKCLSGFRIKMPQI